MVTSTQLALRLSASPAAITYKEGGIQRLYVFVTGYDAQITDGRLLVNYWDGTRWQWADQGKPFGHGLFIHAPSAITYHENGTQRLYVFVTAHNGRLYVNYWDGSQWQWADQGVPPGVSHVSSPNAITYSEGGTQLIYVFVRGADGGLYVNYWDGTQWQWANQHFQANTTIFGGPNVITYNDVGTRRIYTFVTTFDGRLFVNYWDGVQWQWADQGRPSSNVASSLESSPSAITYLHGGLHRLYVFARGKDDNLYVNYWDGTQWQWANQGQPPSLGVPAPSPVTGSPSAITSLDPDARRLYAFVAVQEFETQHPSYLFVNYWDGSQWRWAGKDTLTLRTPMYGTPSVISYVENDTRRLYAFVVGEGFNDDNARELFVSYWDGTEWRWARQCTPENPG